MADKNTNFNWVVDGSKLKPLLAQLTEIEVKCNAIALADPFGPMARQVALTKVPLEDLLDRLERVRLKYQSISEINLANLGATAPGAPMRTQQASGLQPPIARSTTQGVSQGFGYLQAIAAGNPMNGSMPLGVTGMSTFTVSSPVTPYQAVRKGSGISERHTGWGPLSQPWEKTRKLLELESNNINRDLLRMATPENRASLIKRNTELQDRYDRYSPSILEGITNSTMGYGDQRDERRYHRNLLKEIEAQGKQAKYDPLIDRLSDKDYGTIDLRHLATEAATVGKMIRNTKNGDSFTQDSAGMLREHMGDLSKRLAEGDFGGHNTRQVESLQQTLNGMNIGIDNNITASDSKANSRREAYRKYKESYGPQEASFKQFQAANKTTFSDDLADYHRDVREFAHNTRGRRLEPEERAYAQDRIAEATTRKATLLAAQKAGTLTSEHGLTSQTLTGALGKLNSDTKTLEKSLGTTHGALDKLTGGFLRLAASVVGIQLISSMFMKATQEAVEFDRALGRIQATASTMTDPSKRVGLMDSIRTASIGDAKRTGQSLGSALNIQELVHMGASGTNQEKAALGSTFNNLSLATGIKGEEWSSIVAPMTEAGMDAKSIQGFAERTALFKMNHGMTHERFSAMMRSTAGGVGALGELGDLDTLEASARQEAVASRDRVMSSKFNRLDLALKSSKGREHLTQLLSRNGERDEINGTSIEAMLGSGNSSLTIGMISNAAQKGSISNNELMSIAQVIDSRSAPATYAMLKKGLGSYKEEVRSQKDLLGAGFGASGNLAGIATDNIGGAFDKMTNALTVATVEGIGPFGLMLKGLMGVVGGTASALSKMAYVVPVVTSALALFAIALATKKITDVAGDFLGNLGRGAGTMGPRQGTLGSLSGALGSSIGIAGLVGMVGSLAVGGYTAYQDSQNAKVATQAKNNDDALALSMPKVSKASNGDSDVLGVMGEINALQAKGLATKDKQQDLTNQMIETLRAQGKGEADIYALQQAQTTELEKQHALKTIMDQSAEARANTKDVREYNIQLMKVQLDNTQGASTLPQGNIDAMIQLQNTHGSKSQGERLAQRIKDATQENLGTRDVPIYRTTAEGRQAGLGNFMREDNLDPHAFDWMGLAGVKNAPLRMNSNQQARDAARDQIDADLKSNNGVAYNTTMTHLREVDAKKGHITAEDERVLSANATLAMRDGNLTKDGFVVALKTLSIDIANELAKVIPAAQAERFARNNTGISTSKDVGYVNTRAWYLATHPGIDPKNITSKDVMDAVAKARSIGDTRVAKDIGGEGQGPQIITDADMTNAEKIVTDAAAERRNAVTKPIKTHERIPSAVNYLSVLKEMVSTSDAYSKYGDIKNVLKIDQELSKLTAGSGGFDKTVAERLKLSVASSDSEFDAKIATAGLKTTKYVGGDSARKAAIADLMASKADTKLKLQMEAEKLKKRNSHQGRLEMAREQYKGLMRDGDSEIGIKSSEERAMEAQDAAHAGINFQTASDEELAFAKLVADVRHATHTVSDTDLARSDTKKKAQAAAKVAGGIFDEKAFDSETILARKKAVDEQARAVRAVSKSLLTSQDQINTLGASGAAAAAYQTTADMFGTEGDKRQAQRKILDAQTIAAQETLDAMIAAKGPQIDILNQQKKLAEMGIERVKLDEMTIRAQKANAAGQQFTGDVMHSLFADTSANRNSNLLQKLGDLPGQGLASRMTDLFNGMGKDNPLGTLGAGLFDPTGAIDAKNATKNLATSQDALKVSIDALVVEYRKTLTKEQSSYASQGGYSASGAGTGMMIPIQNADGTTSYAPATAGQAGAVYAPMGTSLAGDGSDFLSNDLMSGSSYGSRGAAGSWRTSGMSGPGGNGTPLDPGSFQAGVDKKTKDAALLKAAITANKTGGGTLDKLGNFIPNAAGNGFWAAAGAGRTTNGATSKLDSNGNEVDGNTGGISGAGYAVGGASVGIAAYSAWISNAKNGRAAQNYSAAGAGLTSAGAMVSMTGAGAVVGIPMMAVGMIMSVMGGVAAAQHQSDEKTKQFAEAQAEFSRLISITEGQRTAAGLAADRVLSERADVANSFTGVAASAFLSGRYAANAMTITVQSLQVIANSPMELSAALAGAMTTQVGRGI